MTIKAAWHPYMEIDDEEEIDDVLLDVDVRTVYGDMAHRTELSLFGKGVMLTTEDENAIDDAASMLASDFLHDFTFATRH